MPEIDSRITRSISGMSRGSAFRIANTISLLQKLRGDADGDLLRRIRPDLQPDRTVKRALRLFRQSRGRDILAQTLRLGMAADDAEVGELPGTEDFDEDGRVARVSHRHQHHERILRDLLHFTRHVAGPDL